MSYIKGVKLPFELGEDTWDCSEGAAGQKIFISRLRLYLMTFLELRPEAWGSSRVATGTSGNLSYCLREVMSPFEL